MPEPLQLAHVVPHVDEEASGPSYSVPRLCSALAERGHEVTLHCLAAARPIPGVETALYPQWRRPARLAVSPALARGLYAAASRCDIVHNHSLWSMANMAAGWVVPSQRAKLVLSPRGTLSVWALGHSRRIKQLMWPVQAKTWERAAMLHATSTQERDEIRGLGIRAPVAVIPNGVDMPLTAARDPLLPKRQLLFLSRIHPKKGLDRLFNAWREVASRHPDWELVIAGRGDAEHEAQARTQAQGLERVRFTGPLYGEAKAAAYRGASLFVLPTHSENFGMVVAEALAHGRPCVVTTGAPWGGLVDTGSGWWIGHEADELTATLDAAMALPPVALDAMGARGRDWMQRDFSWEAVAARMEDSYRWILAASALERPSWVDLP